MHTVTFRKHGGPLTAELGCFYGNNAVYNFRLWAPDLATLYLNEVGDFLDLKQDWFDLNSPPESNDDCIIQVIARIGISPGEDKFRFTLTVKQNGTQLPNGFIEECGTDYTQPTKSVVLRCLLQAE